jgi:hypothetical protein
MRAQRKHEGTFFPATINPEPLATESKTKLCSANFVSRVASLRRAAIYIEPEAFVALVPAPDFKSGGSRGDTASAGSIPVRFRQLPCVRADTKTQFASPRAAPRDAC